MKTEEQKTNVPSHTKKKRVKKKKTVYIKRTIQPDIITTATKIPPKREIESHG